MLSVSSATSAVRTVVAKTHSSRCATPDLAYFRARYPLTVARFGGLGEREMWLRRIWELDARFQESLANRNQMPPEVIVRGAPPAHLQVEGEFEIIYAGGTLGLLHAAVMASRCKRRVMVFDAHTVGRTHRDWNISDEELREFERAELFTKDEIEAAIVNRYRAGFVKFHDAASRLKTPPLWMRGVLDVALDADKLLALAAKKVREAEGSLLCDNLHFVRAYIEPHRVSVEAEDARKRRRLFTARLFVDATGTNSNVARQLNNNHSITHVCPTVGTLARGFARGKSPDEPDAVDFEVGEILVSNEDARDHRQLIWEGFAGSAARDEFTTYLFFYDSLDSRADKSLLALFENYFERLPKYKRTGAQWRVVKPVFGFIPSFHHRARSWREWRGNQKQTATDRILLVGDAAGLSSPLTFCGFGSHVRNLRRLTHLTELALKADLLDANALSEINAYEARVSQMASLAEFMRPTEASAPHAVNETMNAVMAALHELDERVRREMFQDRMSFASLKSVLIETAKIYPRIFQRVREHLGARGAFWWIANVLESFLSERRAKNENVETETSADAAQEFARLVRIYRSGGSEKQS
jgi:lycopene cyclase CruA